MAELKTIYFDLSKDVHNNLEHQNDFILKQNELLAANTKNKRD